MAKRTIYCCFNAHSGAFVGFMLDYPEFLNEDHIKIKNIEVDENFDIGTHIWEGDMETGKLVGKYEKTAKTRVYVSQIKAQTRVKLNRVVDAGDLLILLAEQVALMQRRGILTDDDIVPDLKSLLPRIMAIRTHEQRQLNYYDESAHHLLVSEAEQLQATQSRFQTHEDPT